MKFKCKWCDKEHELPSKGDYEYYSGVAHQKETGEILVWEGYKWLQIKDSNLPKGDFKLIRSPSIKDAAIYANIGDYFWNVGHGMTGRWQAIEKKKLISPFSNTVYAIKI